METFKMILGGIITVVIVVGLVVPTVLHYITTLKECRELRRQIDEERKRRENNLTKKLGSKD